MSDEIEMPEGLLDGFPDQILAGMEIFKNLDVFVTAHIDLIEFVQQPEVYPVFLEFLHKYLCDDHASLTIEELGAQMKERLEQQLDACRRFDS